jgi:predicted  nucleic acid-binding Zn-ribbon protein
MSPIGRIFVIINLALSAAFLGFASNNLSAAQKYRGQFDAVTAELASTKTSMQAEIDQITSDRDAANLMRTEMRNQKEALDAKNTALEQELASATDELSELKSDMGNISSSIGDLSSSLDDMKSQVAQANEARAEAINARRDAENARDAAVAAKERADDRSNGLSADLAQAERDLTATSRSLDDANTTIAMIVEATGIDISRGVGAPQIDGAVLQYRADQKLVHINRGTNNKVKRGYIFEIYSGNTYKGQARVEVVNPDTCTAVVVATTGSEIAQGDLVSTQI